MERFCTQYLTPMDLEDSHDLCPYCLGLDHLHEALTDGACMNCSTMPQSLQVARLEQLDHLAGLVSSPLAAGEVVAGGARKRSLLRRTGTAPK